MVCNLLFFSMVCIKKTCETILVSLAKLAKKRKDARIPSLYPFPCACPFARMRKLYPFPCACPFARMRKLYPFPCACPFAKGIRKATARIPKRYILLSFFARKYPFEGTRRIPSPENSLIRIRYYVPRFLKK